VFYQLRGLKLRELEQTVANLRFLEARARFGQSSVEGLLRDYADAQEEIRHLKYSVLKAHLRGQSRHSLLQLLGDFFVFVSSRSSFLTKYPEMLLQDAMNQPDGTGPNAFVAVLWSVYASSPGLTCVLLHGSGLR